MQRYPCLSLIDSKQMQKILFVCLLQKCKMLRFAIDMNGISLAGEKAIEELTTTTVFTIYFSPLFFSPPLQINCVFRSLRALFNQNIRYKYCQCSLCLFQIIYNS